MTLLTTRDCECSVPYFSGKRPAECKHGNRFQTPAELAPPKPRKPFAPVSEKRKVEEEAGTRRRSQSTLKRAEPRRDWTDARAKVDHEGCCRICKRSDRPLEAAHVLGREHDEPKVSRATGEILQELYVHPDRIFPACGPFPAGCHGDAEHRRINVLSHLTLEEQVRAVKDAGGIEPARIRLAPVEHREEVEAERFEPEAVTA